MALKFLNFEHKFHANYRTYTRLKLKIDYTCERFRSQETADNQLAFLCTTTAKGDIANIAELDRNYWNVHQIPFHSVFLFTFSFVALASSHQLEESHSYDNLWGYKWSSLLKSWISYRTLAASRLIFSQWNSFSSRNFNWIIFSTNSTQQCAISHLCVLKQKPKNLTLHSLWLSFIENFVARIFLP